MRRPPQLKIPDHVHPLIRRLFCEMSSQQIGVVEMAEKSGIHKDTFRRWRDKSEPRLSDLDACFNVLGYELTIRDVE